MSDIAVQSYEPTYASGLATYTKPLRVNNYLVHAGGESSPVGRLPQYEGAVSEARH